MSRKETINLESTNLLAGTPALLLDVTFLRMTYWKGRDKQKEISCYRFTASMSAEGRGEAGCIQEPGAHPGLPAVQHSVQHPLPSHKPQHGAAWESEWPGMNSVLQYGVIASHLWP